MSEKELEIESKKHIVESNVDKKYDLVGIINTEKANYENLEKKRKKTFKNLKSKILYQNLTKLEQKKMIYQKDFMKFKKVEMKFLEKLQK